VLSLANFIPDACVRLYELFRSGHYSDAAELHQRLVRVNQATSGSHGVSGVKAAMEIMGCPGGAPRRPLATLSAQDRAKIGSTLDMEGLGRG
jgi:4-hydroxy-2-oxoglutarate aldolase